MDEGLTGDIGSVPHVCVGDCLIWPRKDSSEPFLDLDYLVGQEAMRLNVKAPFSRGRCVAQ